MKFKPIRVLQLSAAALVLSAFAYEGNVYAAAEKAEKAKPPPACRTIKTEAECTPRNDCTWREAVKKGEKITRRASCAAKPKPKPEPKAKTKT